MAESATSRVQPRAATSPVPASGHLSKVVTNVKDLPPWDTVLNAKGQVLGGRHQPTDTLVLGTAADAEHQRVFIVATPEASDGAGYAELILRLYEKHYNVQTTLVADASVLKVVLNVYEASLSGGPQADTSEMHSTWDAIIAEAHGLGASDIHMRAALGRCEFAYRINGDLEPKAKSFTQEQGVALAASMYNTMVDKGSTSDDFNPRAPQSASVTRSVSTGRLRLRFESLPIEPDGISVTLRLISIGVAAKRRTPQELGYAPDQAHALERIFARSSGMILFVGTTGSGKSTSMANLLMQLVADRPGKLLRTVEEPVEIRIPGAAQTSVTRGSGDGDEDAFSTVLRSMMRSDPDYLMVGEIRDSKTANLAIQAVRSGHLCISTLHADGAPIAYDRLVGLGVSRSDVASVGLVAGLIYQRLVPVLCECKVPARSVERTAHAAVLERLATYIAAHRTDLESDYLDRVHFRNPHGCSRCKNKGVVGRTVCAEILIPRPNMLPAIRSGDSNELWRMWRETIATDDHARMTGRTAFEHALWKMSVGEVSPVDVEREFRFLDEDLF